MATDITGIWDFTWTYPIDDILKPVSTPNQLRVCFVSRGETDTGVDIMILNFHSDRILTGLMTTPLMHRCWVQALQDKDMT